MCRLPEFPKQVARKESHELRLYIDIVALEGQQFRVLQKVLFQGWRLTVGQVGNLGGYLVDAIGNLMKVKEIGDPPVIISNRLRRM